MRTEPPGRTPSGGRRLLGVAVGPGPGPESEEGADQGPDETRFINRELSWLEFGARLLQLSSDERIPLSERVRFLCIFSEGLDEFFQVQVASLEDQVAAGLRTRSPDGMSPSDQLKAVTARATALVEWQSLIFRDQLTPALASAGLHLADWASLKRGDRAQLAEVFERHIFPVLTPLAVDQAHPFPYISDLSLNLVVRVDHPATGEQRIARVKVPPLLPRFVVLPDGGHFVPIEQLIAAHLDALFPDMTIVEHHAFRVTRNADVSVEEDEAGDLLAAVELELRRRRFGQAVRLEVEPGLPPDLLAMLIAEVDVPEDNVFLSEVPMDLGGLRSLVELDWLEPVHRANTPVTPPRLATGADLFAVLSERDVLVHHPYESFATSVEAFVAAAADDSEVVAIKQTLYRTGDESPVVASLIRASQAGKQVTAVVELQARFEEQANIAWARALEEAGVQVIYGLVSLKTHAKISLVVRREGDELRRYSHIGTGNYNSLTARAYEDVGLLTASPDIGADLGELFNLLTGSGDLPGFRRLLISPVSARSSLVEAIDQEARAGRAGRIVLKTNGLTDPAVIDALYRASQAGAAVDLIVRERCCLRPGVPGLSDRISVRSIVGRYLEHSRLFRFGGVGGRPLRVWIGSADLMERNLDRRVEVIVPIVDPDLRHRVVRMLDDALRDEANSWVLGPDATWTRLAGPGPLGFSLQDHLEAQALESLRHRHGGSLSPPSALRAAPAPAHPPESSPPVAAESWWRRVRRRDL
ncbi:MAG TPA: polyphosphate kinase 1 [Acidimicrobiales bacterium]|nr:polyphosphate kinase 1 [Acidimicrobiales bacterium]